MSSQSVTQSPRWASAVARARAAVTRVEPTPPASEFPPYALQRPTVPPAPTVRLQEGRPAPSLEPLAALVDLGALPHGPRRLLELLHQLAGDTVQARRYPVTPSQVTMHHAQELLAAALACCVKSVYNWTRRLEALGLLAARPHFTTSKGTTRADGTLYAVALKAGHRAHLTHDDLAHQYRDLDADRAAGRTAWKLFTGSDQKNETEWYQLLRAWAVTPGSFTDSPLVPDPVSGPRTVADVVYTLPLLAQAHPTKRPGLVGILGAGLAHALDDQHSRRYWCRVIWGAWTAEVEGRAGLQVLAAQLARLGADLQEGAPWKNPGAVLAARLRPVLA